MERQHGELERGKAAKTEERSWAWRHKEVGMAWEAAQTMSLQGSYLCGGEEVGAPGGRLSLLCWAPETPYRLWGVVVWSWEQPSLCFYFSSAKGSRASECLCSGAEGSLLGAASDVTGPEQSKEEEGSVHGAADTSSEAGQTTGVLRAHLVPTCAPP